MTVHILFGLFPYITTILGGGGVFKNGLYGGEAPPKTVHTSFGLFPYITTILGGGGVFKNSLYGGEGRGSTKDCSHFVRSISLHNYNLPRMGEGGCSKTVYTGRGSTKDRSHFVQSPPKTFLTSHMNVVCWRISDQP